MADRRVASKRRVGARNLSPLPSGASRADPDEDVVGADVRDRRAVQRAVASRHGQQPGDQLDQALALDVGAIGAEGRAAGGERVVQLRAGELGRRRPAGHRLPSSGAR